MKKGLDVIILLVLLIGILLLFITNLTFGRAEIPGAKIIDILMGEPASKDTWPYIIEHRLNRSLAALFGGGALAVSGLLLQVFFRNPLAGPGVLGITSGASLGVAIVILGGITLDGILGSASIIFFGIIGAMGVLLLLLFISRFVKNQVTLLVIGLMLGYFTSAFINMLYMWSSLTETREFVIWGLGSFEGLTSSAIAVFVFSISGFLLLSFLLIKGLNALVLGEDYARSLGVNMKSLRVLLIIITSVLAAIVTVYCGPVSFIGIAVPQLIRAVVKSRNHAFLIPLVFLGGAFLGIAADFAVRASDNFLPLNTVTALIGAPIIIWTIIKMNKRFARM